MARTRAILSDVLKNNPLLVVLSEVKIKMKMEKLDAYQHPFRIKDREINQHFMKIVRRISGVFLPEMQT